MRQVKALWAAMFLAYVTPECALAKNLEAVYGEWAVFSHKERKDKWCYALGYPVKMSGGDQGQQQAFAMYARLKGSKKGDVSLSQGSAFKSKAKVTADVNGVKYLMLSHKDRAWAKDSKDNEGIVEAMKKGDIMVVSGYSAENHRLEAVYSLMGFSKAIQRAKELCN